MLSWFAVWRRSSHRGLRFLEAFPERSQADAMLVSITFIHGAESLIVDEYYPWWVW